jgi:hypothetical protein
MTQCERVLKYIDDFGSITPIEAMADLGIMRLASRISDLKKAGYPIRKETAKGISRYGKPTHFARYSMGGQDG